VIRAAGIKAELSGSQCPLWVKSSISECLRNVRSSPESGH